jgi:hypothetical protein
VGSAGILLECLPFPEEGTERGHWDQNDQGSLGSKRTWDPTKGLWEGRDQKGMLGLGWGPGLGPEAALRRGGGGAGSAAS